MGEIKIAVGDEVRVHFHPPGPMKSFTEGVVSRVDVTTPEGRFFVVEVTHEVLLDREHRIRRGFPDFVRYECRNDFPGRIEILSTAPDMEQGSEFDLTVIDPPEERKQEADEPPRLARQLTQRLRLHKYPKSRLPPNQLRR